MVFRKKFNLKTAEEAEHFFSIVPKHSVGAAGKNPALSIAA